MDLDAVLELAFKYATAAKRTIVSKKPEAPKWAPFGQWAWTAYREGTPDGPETELEKEVYKALQKHFGDYHNKRTGLSRPIASMLSMMMVVGWYKPILHPPPQKTLYRGMKFKSAKALAEFLNVEESFIEHNKSMDFSKEREFPTINGHSTSWTAKKMITKDFSNADKKGYALTLIADTKSNPYKFVAGPGGLYDVDGLSMYHLEKETVGLEPISVRRAEWVEL